MKRALAASLICHAKEVSAFWMNVGGAQERNNTGEGYTVWLSRIR